MIPKLLKIITIVQIYRKLFYYKFLFTLFKQNSHYFVFFFPSICRLVERFSFSMILKYYFLTDDNKNRIIQSITKIHFKDDLRNDLVLTDLISSISISTLRSMLLFISDTLVFSIESTLTIASWSFSDFSNVITFVVTTSLNTGWLPLAESIWAVVS